MREYLFRGKTIGYRDNEWVEGFLLKKPGISTTKYLIAIPNSGTAYEVDPETVGQYTGLTDNNGRKIFEGDIFEVERNVQYIGRAKRRMGLFKAIFYKGCFMKQALPNSQMSFYENSERAAMYHFITPDETEIVGNIYDNPELLGGEKDD